MASTRAAENWNSTTSCSPLSVTLPAPPRVALNRDEEKYCEAMKADFQRRHPRGPTDAEGDWNPLGNQFVVAKLPGPRKDWTFPSVVSLFEHSTAIVAEFHAFLRFDPPVYIAYTVRGHMAQRGEIAHCSLASSALASLGACFVGPITCVVRRRWSRPFVRLSPFVN